jgi:hypothetical protein
MAWSTRPAAPAGGRILAESDGATLDRIELLSTPPAVHLRQTSAQTLTTGTGTAILFDTEDLDNYSGHSTSSNTSRYTCQLAGWYKFSGGIGWASNGTGRRGTWWRKNGTDVNGSEVNHHAGGTGILGTPARTIFISLAVNDYVELMGIQESGGNLNTGVTATQQPTMSAILIIPAA